MTEAADRLYQMISGFGVTQLVRTAALLGIPAAPAGGPRDGGRVATSLHGLRAVEAKGTSENGPARALEQLAKAS